MERKKPIFNIPFYRGIVIQIFRCEDLEASFSHFQEVIQLGILSCDLQLDFWRSKISLDELLRPICLAHVPERRLTISKNSHIIESSIGHLLREHDDLFIALRVRLFNKI